MNKNRITQLNKMEYSIGAKKYSTTDKKGKKYFNILSSLYFNNNTSLIEIIMCITPLFTNGMNLT